MKKILAVFVIASCGLMTFSSVACPLGTHLTGGIGSHHKGGHCTSESAAGLTRNIQKDAQIDMKGAKDTVQKDWKKTKNKTTKMLNKSKTDMNILEKNATQRANS
ncbi:MULTISPECIES: hypothetical protein [Pantoea]|uniref:Lipoprotein n=1 Tax=Candidatus Pantoea gossypiicola TaxID=2608008 RepID=A0AB34CDX5_9GAMM|nr:MULTISPECIES: hypothetical protein [Pantoea]KAA5920895.1 hypothetical protein F3I59_23605 [Pantoea sp. VH_8]KAA5927673.1 hypothetical protein F3I58_23350 [Pantoea sp. VH_4]KAA5977777.1 hypothetical protein F3I49_23380 [Pantoea sp. M_4]KAA6117895.1 hypothetical protein F3I20_23555 [Pantoea gossypiicola]